MAEARCDDCTYQRVGVVRRISLEHAKTLAHEHNRDTGHAVRVTWQAAETGFDHRPDSFEACLPHAVQGGDEVD